MLVDKLLQFLRKKTAAWASSKRMWSILAIFSILAAISVLLPFKSQAPSPAPATDIPQFPWPPPRASTFEVIPRELLVTANQPAKLRDINTVLDAAFRECGYVERSYYAVPDGFAIASRIEQINEDGTIGKNRWSLDVPQMTEFSLRTYLEALFRAQRPGRYRIIVFIVTPHPFTQTDAKVTQMEARAWLHSGLNSLPAFIGDRDCSPSDNCTALIYEFKGTKIKKAEFVDPSDISADIHLANAGLLAAFSKLRSR